MSCGECDRAREELVVWDGINARSGWMNSAKNGCVCVENKAFEIIATFFLQARLIVETLQE
jgi:hypothetical protein